MCTYDDVREKVRAMCLYPYVISTSVSIHSVYDDGLFFYFTSRTLPRRTVEIENEYLRPHVLVALQRAPVSRMRNFCVLPNRCHRVRQCRVHRNRIAKNTSVVNIPYSRNTCIGRIIFSYCVLYTISNWFFARWKK